MLHNFTASKHGSMWQLGIAHISCALHAAHFRHCAESWAKLNGLPHGMGCCLSVSNGCIVAKWCEIGPRLLLISNSKSHIAFQMT